MCIRDSCKPLCDGAEHDGPVGDGFISGNPDFALEMGCSFKFHNLLPNLSLGLHAEHLVFVFVQPLPCSLHGSLVIEGNLKRSLTPFAVVVDADILNADALGSQDNGYGGDGAHLIAYIHSELIGWLHGSPVSYTHLDVYKRQNQG